MFSLFVLAAPLPTFYCFWYLKAEWYKNPEKDGHAQLLVRWTTSGGLLEGLKSHWPFNFWSNKQLL